LNFIYLNQLFLIGKLIVYFSLFDGFNFDR
jgi:hypothetical protein